MRILVTGACQLNQGGGGRIRILNGPVYCLETVKSNLREYGLFVINDQAQIHQGSNFSPELSDEELIKFILALELDDLIESERCSTSVGRTLDCDAYAMKWNRIKHSRWEHAAKIYVKFGFAENHPKVLVVSIHPSKY